MHGGPFSGIGNPDVCMGMSHAYKRQSINTFIHTHAYTVIHAYHLVVHAYSCIHPMPICHAYQSGYKHHGRMHTYMDAMHVYMHTLMYILMHILIHMPSIPSSPSLSSLLVSSSSICDAGILSSVAQSIPHLFT